MVLFQPVWHVTSERLRLRSLSSVSLGTCICCYFETSVSKTCDVPGICISTSVGISVNNEFSIDNLVNQF